MLEAHKATRQAIFFFVAASVHEKEHFNIILNLTQLCCLIIGWIAALRSQRQAITVGSLRHELLKKMGASRGFFQRKIWHLQCRDEDDLAVKLQELNENNFMFAGGSSGWNPSDIYIHLRDKNMVAAKVTEIVWTSPDVIMTREV